MFEVRLTYEYLGELQVGLVDLALALNFHVASELSQSLRSSEEDVVRARLWVEEEEGNEDFTR